MDDKLHKLWAAAEALLREAMAELPTPDPQVLEYLSHNELGLALDDLVELGERTYGSSKFWHLLKLAADLMGANKHRAGLTHRYREAMKLEHDGRDAQRT